MGSGLNGDFMSFKLDGTHSTSLGITRVSDGSRYNENLLPTMADKTAQVGGADETYYFGTDYTQKPIAIPIAFDGLTDLQLRQLRAICARKAPMPLVYDELPYKYYMVKSTGNSTIKYVAFNDYQNAVDGNPPRIYKGSGTLTFTAYYPYAKCEKKYLNQYDECFTIVNDPQSATFQLYTRVTDEDGAPLYVESTSPIEEGQSYYQYVEPQWVASSGLRQKKTVEDSWYQEGEEWNIITYNPGDMSADYKIYFQYDEDTQAFNLLTLSVDDVILGFSSPIERINTSDQYICVDSHANLIYGVDENYVQTGSIYNKYLTSGIFTRIPVGENRIKINTPPSKLEYDYIYY